MMTHRVYLCGNGHEPKTGSPNLSGPAIFKPHHPPVLLPDCYRSIWPVSITVTQIDRTRPAQFVFPGSLAPRSPFPVTGAVPYKRSTDVTWRLSEPRSRGMVVVPPSAGFAKRNGARAFTIVLLPSSTRPVRQVAFSAFVPDRKSVA